MTSGGAPIDSGRTVSQAEARLAVGGQAERPIGSIHRECLYHAVVFGEAQARILFALMG
jgi:hypothetical protein